MTTRPKSTAALLQAIKLARENPSARFDIPGHFPLYAGDVLNLWERGVHARASRGLPALSQRAERFHTDMQIDARRINDHARGIRHTGCRGLLRTTAMQARYPHINNQPRDS